MLVAALAPRCPPGSSACKVSGTSPRGTADQARIKALGGEATARVDRPFPCCTQGCWQGTVAVQGDSRGCHRVMGTWKESLNCSTRSGQAEIHPITWVPNWGSTHGAGARSQESPMLWAPRTTHTGGLGVQEVNTEETQED